MKKNITIPQLSEKIGISTRAIKKQIAKLKQEGVLERIGSARSGFWQLNEKKEDINNSQHTDI